MLAARAAKRGGNVALKSWRQAIAAQPSGRSRLSASTTYAGAGNWELQRTVIEDAASEAPRAYYNILRANSETKPMTDALKHIEPMLNQLTLHASFVAYGSDNRREKSIVGTR